MARQDLEQQRHVGDGASQRADLVQATGKRDQTVPADAAVGRFQPGHAAERGWLADGTARVAADGQRRHAGGQAGCCAAARTARHAFRIPRIPRRAEVRVLGRSAHRELVHVRFADQDGARMPQTRDHGGVVRRRKLLQHPRRTGRWFTDGTQVVLDRHGKTSQRSQRLASASAIVHFDCTGQCRLAVDAQESVDGGVVGGDLAQKSARQLDGRHLAGIESSQQVNGRTVAK